MPERKLTMKDWQRIKADVLNPYIEGLKTKAVADQLQQIQYPPGPAPGTHIMPDGTVMLDSEMNMQETAQ